MEQEHGARDPELGVTQSLACATACAPLPPRRAVRRTGAQTVPLERPGERAGAGVTASRRRMVWMASAVTCTPRHQRASSPTRHAAAWPRHARARSAGQGSAGHGRGRAAHLPVVVEVAADGGLVELELAQALEHRVEGHDRVPCAKPHARQPRGAVVCPAAPHLHTNETAPRAAQQQQLQQQHRRDAGKGTMGGRPRARHERCAPLAA